MQNMVLQNKDIKIEHASTKSVIKEFLVLTSKGQPFEVINKMREDVNYQAFSTLPENLKAMYKDSAETYGDADFIIYKDERYSFLDLYQRASEFACALVEEYQISEGDRVTISMRNYPEWIVAFMAITSIGAIAVPLNSWWQQEEFAQVMGHCDAKLAIVDDKRYDLLSTCLAKYNTPVIIARPSLEQIAKVTVIKNIETFETLVAKYNGQSMPQVNVGSDAIATIFYTSGSTGAPKGAVSSHESILTAITTWLMLGVSAAAANADQNIEPLSSLAPAALMTVPLFHVTGCHTLFLLSMIMGRKTIMMPYWEAEEALRLIEKEKITYFNGVPTMSMELMNHPNRSKYDVSSLSDISAGGAARPPEHVRKIYESFKGNPSCGYGLTETNALGAVNGAVDYIHKPNSAGLPTPPIVQVKILNEEDEALEAGEQGEIVIKSISNILGYWRNPEATDAAFINGYFRTGDLGYLDEDGFIYIVDRAKDIIIRGGENISCFEVESSLYKHSLVVEASVFSLPDERLGEVVGAVIYVEDASEKNTSAEISEVILQEFVTEHLAKFKVPSKIWIINEKLPRLGSGKIDKRTLKETYIR